MLLDDSYKYPPQSEGEDVLLLTEEQEKYYYEMMKEELNEKPIPIRDTRIETAGVYRCCLESVASEYSGQTVKVGDKSQCQHCGEKFTLVKEGESYVWKPDWQIKEGGAG